MTGERVLATASVGAMASSDGGVRVAASRTTVTRWRGADTVRGVPDDVPATTRPSDTPSGRAIRRFRVTVLGDRATVWQAGAERCAIGSHPSNDLVIEDATVSRFHCELTIAGSIIRVRDLGSRNGTSANGLGLVDATIPGGTILVLGHAQVRVDVDTVELSVAASARTAFGSLVGRSAAMREVFSHLEKVAATSTTILLQGETGTGKEAAAEAIHDAGPRAAKPFVVVDCSSFADAELDAAAGGTLFLDEVGDLPAGAQPKLLRQLDRISETTRVIAATSRDLRSEVNRGTFRAELYFRIAVVKVDLPPLRERTVDVPLLVEHLARALGASPAQLASLTAPDFVAALAALPWPGNVRELRNHLEQCVVFGESRLPSASAPPREPIAAGAALPYELARKQAIDDFERRYVTLLLERTRDNVAAAARAAGVNRAYLHRLLRRHGLR